jgi:RNA polymerase-interacting CarD/CdnL/TRCF family regulator
MADQNVMPEEVLLDVKVAEASAPYKFYLNQERKILGAGSAFDLAKIIGSLTELNETKALSPRDRRVLEKARKHLICEISEVIGESKSEAEEQLDNALNITKRRMRSSERQAPESASG